MHCYGWVPHMSDRLDTIFPERSPTGYTVLERMTKKFASHSADTLRDVLKLHGGNPEVSLRIEGQFYDTVHTLTVALPDGDVHVAMTVSRSGMMHLESLDVPVKYEKNLLRVLYHFMKLKLHDETHHIMVDRKDSEDIPGYVEVPRPVFCDTEDEALGRISDDFVRMAHNSMMQICRTVPKLVSLSRLDDLMFRMEMKGQVPDAFEAREMVGLAVSCGLFGSLSELEGLSRRKLRAEMQDRLDDRIEKQNRLVTTVYESSKGTLCYARNFARLFAGRIDSEGLLSVLENDADAIDVLYNVHRNNEEHRMAGASGRMNQISTGNGKIAKRLTYVIVFLTVTSAVMALYTMFL